MERELIHPSLFTWNTGAAEGEGGGGGEKEGLTWRWVVVVHDGGVVAAGSASQWFFLFSLLFFCIFPFLYLCYPSFLFLSFIFALVILMFFFHSPLYLYSSLFFSFLFSSILVFFLYVFFFVSLFSHPLKNVSPPLIIIRGRRRGPPYSIIAQDKVVRVAFV